MNVCSAADLFVDLYLFGVVGFYLAGWPGMSLVIAEEGAMSDISGVLELLSSSGLLNLAIA